MFSLLFLMSIKYKRYVHKRKIYNRGQYRINQGTDSIFMGSVIL